jgi:hypothetical protein
MKPLTIERILVAAALAGGLLVLGMLGIAVGTGVGQDALQVVRPVAEYERVLSHDMSLLRAVLTLDNLFIVCYATVFVTLGVLLAREGANRPLLYTAMAALGALALLDMIENMHFLTMLGAVEQGLDVSANEIRLQVFESMLKFHVSYAGLFLLGTVMPRRTVVEKVLAASLMFVQLPVGVLIYTAPPLAPTLLVVRTFSFVAGMAMIAAIYGRRPSVTPARVALAA